MAGKRTFQHDALEKVALKHYLLHADDVRKCPTSNCTYSGFLEEGYCAENIKCHTCKTEWRDQAHYSQSEKLGQVFKDLKSLNSSHITQFRSLMLEEPCPKCGVMIYKSGGCQHMICGRCRYEFCWHCLGPYFSYRH